MSDELKEESKGIKVNVPGIGEIDGRSPIVVLAQTALAKHDSLRKSEARALQRQ